MFTFVGFYRPRKLGLSFPRLYDIAEGEAISSALLQLNPDNRISSADALKHPYFNPLPKKLYELPDGKQLNISWTKLYRFANIVNNSFLSLTLQKHQFTP